MQMWHSRLWEGIEKANNTNSEWLDPENLAASGDLYKLGRYLNYYVTSLLTSLRVTGDLKLLDEADRLMEIARVELADYNADGYLNWRYLNSNGGNLYNDDYHVMDDILTHSLVAAVAAALHENAAFDPRYAEHAAFWTDYLRNDFEAKWRRRNDVPFGFPFMSKHLMHPYVQFIRYHHYMYQLTGEYGYQGEAEQRAEAVTSQFREVFTPGGPAYVWAQILFPERDGLAGPLGCQPFNYLRNTFQALQDLALEGLEVFDTSFMQHVATAMSSLVMDDGYHTFAKDICGGVARAGLRPSSADHDRGITYHFVNFPFAVVGKWDATGEIQRTLEKAYDEVDFEDKHYSLGLFNISAEMLFLLANNPDSR